VFTPDQGGTIVDCEVTIADGKWTTDWVAGRTSVSGESRRGVLATGTSRGGAIFGPLEIDAQGNGKLWLSFEGGDNGQPDGVQWRVVCEDLNGQVHVSTSKDGMTIGKITGGVFKFDVPADQIREVQIQTRPYAKRAVAKGISLDPNKPSMPTLSAADTTRATGR
jgi:hypothetical protein